LKAAPVSQPTLKAPLGAKSFQGLGKGFLNTHEAKQRGLKGPKAAELACVAVEVARASSTTAAAASGMEGIPQHERTRINPLPEAEGLPCFSTNTQERLALLLPSADLHPGMSEGLCRFSEQRPPAPTAKVGGGPEPEELEPLQEPHAPPPSLSELAEQLFGELARQQEAEAKAPGEGSVGEKEGRTASAKTPSPMVASSCDGGAASERGEAAAQLEASQLEAGPSEVAGPEAVLTDKVPMAGLRWLRQRRRERSEAMRAEEFPLAKAVPAKDESEDLVNLWMKQRW